MPISDIVKTIQATTINPIAMLKPRRKIVGYSAILLPFKVDGSIDWKGFENHVARTHHAGLHPAVNMDTGYGNLIDDNTKRQALKITQQVCAGGEYTAGAGAFDKPGSAFDLATYQKAVAMVVEHGGTPTIFQSFGLTALDGDDLVDAYAKIGQGAPKFIAFELGKMFAPFGAIYSLDTYAKLMQVSNCIGAKHSSLSRTLEWQRLLLRDQVRPDWRVFTGNDLAVDLVCYGSDYLLGLSTFAPEEFAKRDAYWHHGDARFYELNDVLQYLGFFAFRAPVPAYKHTAAMFLKLRGFIDHDATHPKSPTRPDSDRSILAEMLPMLSTDFADVAD
jgi:dihydrodipicolinate synthase/N-acetylneuraminate lyase